MHDFSCGWTAIAHTDYEDLDVNPISLFRMVATGMALMIGSVVYAQLPGLPHSVPGDDTVSVAAGDQTAPDVSSGGAVQLAVWADERANPYVYNEYETSVDIYGMRLNADGAALDPVPIAVSAARGSQTGPKVAWNGEAWLVVFRTTALSGTGFYYQTSLAAVRVAADGSVVDADPIPLPGMGTGQYAVASDGVGWVVASQGNDVTGDIVAVRVTADGEVLDPPIVTLVDEGSVTGSGIRLAHAGGTFLLTYTGRTGTGAILFEAPSDPNQVITPLGDPFVLLDGAYISGLGGNDSGFYIAWNRQRPDYTLTIMGSRVGVDGSLLDGDGVDLAGASAPQGNVVGVAWDGIHWRVGWLSSGGLQLIRVDDATGQPVNPGGTAIAGVQAGPMGGTGSGGVQVVWSAFGNNEYDVFGATVDAADQLLASAGISTGQPRQYRSDVAAGAGGYMLVYRSAIAGQVSVLAQPLGVNGEPLTGLPIELDSGATLSGPGSPAVAWNGDAYLVSWGDSRGIVAQRISQNGALIDSTPTLLMNPGFGPVDVAAVGSDFLVVGRRFGSSIEYIFPIGARVSGSTGALLDPTPIQLGASSGSQPFTVYAREPAVTAMGDRWLAAWHSNLTHDESVANSIGVFVDSNGQRGAPFLIGWTATGGGNYVNQIDVASSGSNALFIQSREITSGVENDLEGFLINADRSVHPLGSLTPWSGNQYRPAISFDGRDYIAVFQDQKNRLAPHTLEQLDARGDLYGMRIRPDGTTIDPQGFLIDDSPIGETDLAIASRGSDTLIVASQMRNDGVASNYRISLGDVLDGSNRFPVAVANASVRSGDAPLEVVLDATGSKDPEGGALNYLWDFADATTSTAPGETHLFAAPGEYPVLLTVTDVTGRSSSQAIVVNVTAPNLLPVAVASASRFSGPTPLNVILYADGSYDPDGSLGNIEWRSSDGRLYYGSPAYFNFSNPGTYTVTLRVYDSRGEFGEDTLTIVAGGDNQPPIAAASATPTSGDAPLAVAFSSSGSGDADGSIVSYAWNFGDGTSGGGANPSHTFASVGSYTATLTVTDNSGASASDSLIITVSGLSDRALQTAIDMATAKVRGVPMVIGTVTVLNGLGEPQRSVIVSGRWTLPDGSSLSRTQYSDRRGEAAFSVPVAGDGTYTLQVLNATLAGSLFDPVGSETTDSITLGGPGDSTPPVMPVGLVATAGDAQVALDWTDNSDPDLAGYHVERAAVADGAFSRLTALPVTVSQYGDTGLTNGLTYHYRVVAVDTSNNESEPSDVVSARPQGGGSGTPTSLHVAAITLSTANAGKGSKIGVATVIVVDNNGSPVEGATVTGTFSGSYEGDVAANTGANGTAQLDTGSSVKGTVSFGFCIMAVEYTGLTYEAQDNAETCDVF